MAAFGLRRFSLVLLTLVGLVVLASARPQSTFQVLKMLNFTSFEPFDPHHLSDVTETPDGQSILLLVGSSTSIGVFKYNATDLTLTQSVLVPFAERFPFVRRWTEGGLILLNSTDLTFGQMIPFAIDNLTVYTSVVTLQQINGLILRDSAGIFMLKFDGSSFKLVNSMIFSPSYVTYHIDNADGVIHLGIQSSQSIVNGPYFALIFGVPSDISEPFPLLLNSTLYSKNDALKWWWPNAYLSVNKTTQLFVDYHQQLWWITLNQPTSRVRQGLDLVQPRPTYATIASAYLKPFVFLQAGDNITTIYRFKPDATSQSQVDRLDIHTEAAQTTRFARSSVPGRVWVWVYFYDVLNPMFGLWLLGDADQPPSQPSTVRFRLS